MDISAQYLKTNENILILSGSREHGIGLNVSWTRKYLSKIGRDIDAVKSSSIIDLANIFKKNKLSGIKISS